MRIMHLEAQRKAFQSVPNLDSLPQKIGLLYTIQYKPLFEKIKKELEKKGKKVIVGKALLSEGQIIGCNIDSALLIQEKIDCFALVSSGKFHAASLMLNTDKPIYIIGEKVEKIPQQEIDALKKRRKAAVSKFLLADKIGIIVSTKHGQQKMNDALKIKKELSNKKKVFLFVSDSINLKELENFKIDSWINTACPGLALDAPNVINLSEYRSIEKFK